tara:strand:- start:927 stop:1403 length:477 start_codon:yes stop_codon:yes gene_type:complete
MSLYQYGNDITYQSLPDYDTLVPFDTAWDCEDWRIYFERLEEEFGTDQARRIWNNAWSNNGANADVLSCKYGEAWRNWADSNGLIYDHLILGQIDSWMYDTGSAVGGAVTGVGQAVQFLGKNFKYIIAGALVFVGLYAYKNYIKGNEKINLNIKPKLK